jgi:hypothetical protein
MQSTEQIVETSFETSVETSVEEMEKVDLPNPSEIARIAFESNDFGFTSKTLNHLSIIAKKHGYSSLTHLRKMSLEEALRYEYKYNDSDFYRFIQNGSRKLDYNFSIYIYQNKTCVCFNSSYKGSISKKNIELISCLGPVYLMISAKMNINHDVILPDNIVCILDSFGKAYDMLDYIPRYLKIYRSFSYSEVFDCNKLPPTMEELNISIYNIINIPFKLKYLYINIISPLGFKNRDKHNKYIFSLLPYGMEKLSIIIFTEHLDLDLDNLVSSLSCLELSLPEINDMRLNIANLPDMLKIFKFTRKLDDLLYNGSSYQDDTEPNFTVTLPNNLETLILEFSIVFINNPEKILKIFTNLPKSVKKIYLHRDMFICYKLKRYNIDSKYLDDGYYDSDDSGDFTNNTYWIDNPEPKDIQKIKILLDDILEKLKTYIKSRFDHEVEIIFTTADIKI